MIKKKTCAKGPVTRCNFPGNLQRNSTLKRCKLVTNVCKIGKYTFAPCERPLARDVVLNHTFELLINTTMLFDIFEMSISINKRN